MNQLLGIIPARGGSKRFPRKNLAPLCGKPLLLYTIEAAVQSGICDVVCVSSEDDEILDLASRQPGVVALRRPAGLSLDTAQVKEVCGFILEDFAKQGRTFEDFAVLLVTNPFRTGSDLRSAYEVFKKSHADSIMSLVPFSHPPQRAVGIEDGFARPYFGIQYMKPAQALDPLYRHDGSVIISRTNAFLKEKEFYGERVAPYFMPLERSVDIDHPIDLLWAEFLLSRR